MNDNELRLKYYQIFGENRSKNVSVEVMRIDLDKYYKNNYRNSNLSMGTFQDVD